MMFQLDVAPGLTLRQFTLPDAEAVFAAADRDREYLRVWLPWVDQTHSAEDSRRFIRGAQAQFEAALGPNCGIWSAGALAGSVGCHTIDWSNRKCSIGYWVSADMQGRGIVTRSVAAMLDYLFEDLQLHRVLIECGTENLKSCAVPQRLGFQREGVARQAEWVGGRWVDLVQWAMLRWEWAARKK
ncbi:MAG TPA: GNAT family protein [Candidatus Limnocylindrales bacterium]|nr:GNAT family protein [Candidatus Limnocylindrales bacterium]